MLQEILKADLKKIANSTVVSNLSKQFNQYEHRVKKFVNEFDLRSREARDRSRQQIDQFTNQLQKTRKQVEKRVTQVIEKEGKRLNGRATELFNYLKSVAKNEKIALKAAATSAQKKASAPKARPRAGASTTKKAKRKTNGSTRLSSRA